ncbi:MAG: hypothetical protein R3E84_04870 [Pseudomonadales bacterium]
MAFGILLTAGLLPGVLPSPALAAESLGAPVGVPFTRELPAGATLSAVDVFHDEEGITGILVHYRLPSGLFNLLPIAGHAGARSQRYELVEGDELRAIRAALDAGGGLRGLVLVSSQGNSGLIGADPGVLRRAISVPEGARLTGLSGFVNGRLTSLALVTRAPAGAGIAQVPDRPAYRGGRISTRDFTCLDNGSEADSTAEVFGDLTLAWNAGEGERNAFLLASGRPEDAMDMPCAPAGPVVRNPALRHVDVHVPAATPGRSGGSLWFLVHLREADDGSFIDPHDDLGDYTTQLVRFPVDGSAVSVPVVFTGTDSSDPRLRITVDIVPYY